MKYPTHMYAKALVEVLSDPKLKGAREQERAAANFLALIRKNNEELHLKKILEEAARFARGKGGVRKVTLASARSLTAAQRKSLGALAREDDVVEERINPALVAGVKVIINDELQWDGTLKGTLDKVFNM